MDSYFYEVPKELLDEMSTKCERCWWVGWKERTKKEKEWCIGYFKKNWLSIAIYPDYKIGNLSKSLCSMESHFCYLSMGSRMNQGSKLVHGSVFKLVYCTKTRKGNQNPAKNQTQNKYKLV